MLNASLPPYPLKISGSEYNPLLMGLFFVELVIWLILNQGDRIPISAISSLKWRRYDNLIKS